MIDACIEAYNVNGDKNWIEEARRCFDWFLGRNDLNVPLYDYTTGGRRDGLNTEGANLNQGAESTLAWLLSRWCRKVGGESESWRKLLVVKP